MYRPKRSGYTTVNGQTVRYIKGEVCHYDLSHISHAERVVSKQDVKKTVVETVIPDNAYPVHKGAGYYELSNGEKVRGKAKAIEAQNKLD